MAKRIHEEEEAEEEGEGAREDDGREDTLYRLPPVREIVDASLGGLRNLLRFLSATKVGEETVEATLRDAIRRDIVRGLDWSRRARSDGRAPSPECLWMEAGLFGVGAKWALYPANFMNLWDFNGDSSKEHFSMKARLRQFDKLELIARYRSVFDGLVVLACIALKRFVRCLPYVGPERLEITIRDGGNALFALQFQHGIVNPEVYVDDTPFAVSLFNFAGLLEDRDDDSYDADDTEWLRAFADLLFDLFYNVSPRCAITFDAAEPHEQQLGPDEEELESDLPPPFAGGTLALRTNGQLERREGKTVVYSNVYD
jgi:hypothetical protein